MKRRDVLRTLAGAAALAPLSAVTTLAGASGQRQGVPAPPRARLPRVHVSPDGHSLQTDDGRPFFWLGDTAWELIHSTTPDETAFYLRTRARQGFTVIQAVALAELDGLNRPDEQDQRPFVDNDPTRPNSAYFDHVVAVVDRAADEGLYVALLPTWADKVTAPWGAGPRIFTTDNLPAVRGYGRFLGNLLRERTNVIWMLGGDRPPRVSGALAGVGAHTEGLARRATAAGFATDVDWTPIWREMAVGITAATEGRPLITYHPQGGFESTSVFLHGERWLDVNGMQSGHGGGHDVPVWEWIARDYALTPPKPTLDLEPNYEDHPYNPWPSWDPANGYFRDHDVRKQTYRSVFAGGCGVTYGHHAVWQFAGKRREVLNHPDRDWIDALWRPAARQMQFLRWLAESRPWFTRIPDQALIVGDAGSGGVHLQAMRDAAGSWAFVYFPLNDQAATIDLGRLAARRITGWWYDPRTGAAHPLGELAGGAHRAFRSPPYGPDWVLVLDDAARRFPPPGMSERA